MVIKIIDLVAKPSTYDDGQVVYDAISKLMKKGEKAVVSFSGIASVPSAFVNSAFIRLLEEFSYDEIKSFLVIVDSTRHINELIKGRFDFVISQASKPAKN
jgi:hypothetical protein